MTEIVEGMTTAQFISAINDNSLLMGDDIDDTLVSTYLSTLNRKFDIYNKTYLQTNSQISAGVSGSNFISILNSNFNLRQDGSSLDLLTLSGSGTFIPVTESNLMLAKYKGRKIGGLISFGLLTFQYDWLRPINPYLFNLTNIDADTWVANAADSGIEYLVLTILSASGFSMFDNPINYPDYILNQVYGYKKCDVSLVGADTNIIDKFITACEKYNIAWGLYFATIFNHAMVWKRGDWSVLSPMSGYDATTKQYYDNWCAKTLQYITTTWNPEFIWLDVAGAGTPCNNMQVLYDAIKNINPNCIVIGNSIGDQSFAWFPYDIGSNEENFSTGGAKTWDTVLATSRGHNGTTYYVPQELVANNYGAGETWYWTASKSLRTQQSIQDIYNIAKARSAPFLLNIAPNTSGVIPTEQLALFSGLSL